MYIPTDLKVINAYYTKGNPILRCMKYKHIMRKRKHK